MSDLVLELAERSRALIPEERARLVDLLLTTLEDTVSPMANMCAALVCIRQLM